MPATLPSRNEEVMRMFIGRWRALESPLRGLPVEGRLQRPTLRTGKRLSRELTEVAVTLKPVPHFALVPGRVPRGLSRPPG